MFLKFDRCKGIFYDPKYSYVPKACFGGGGSCFSANNQFVYLTHGRIISRVEFSNTPDILPVSYELTSPDQTTLFHLSLAADGRIYGVPVSSEYYLHIIYDTINLANPPRVSIQTRGFPLMLPNARSLPKYINRNLASLVNSQCDTISTYIGTIKNQKINIFPNPGRGYIVFENLPSQDLLIQIFASTGKEVHKQNSNKLTGVKIHTNSFDNGVYFFIIQNKKGSKLYEGKFIVQ